MSDIASVLTLRRQVAIWSDQVQKEAAKFADAHRDLFPRPITTAQLYGLLNIVRSAHRFSEIQRFIQHQREKAERAGRPDVRGYWTELEKKLTSLKNKAKQLWQQTEGSNKPESLDELYCQLSIEFVQHLIAHSLYWSPVKRERSRSER
jgi:hypothetical protein